MYPAFADFCRLVVSDHHAAIVGIPGRRRRNIASYGCIVASCTILVAALGVATIATVVFTGTVAPVVVIIVTPGIAVVPVIIIIPRIMIVSITVAIVIIVTATTIVV